MTETESHRPIEIDVEAPDPQVLDDAAQKLWHSIVQTGSQVDGPYPLSTQVDRYLILRATPGGMRRKPFERRTHRRLLTVVQPARGAMVALMNIIVPAGVDIRIRA